jgi:FimV-like protein
MQAGQSDDALAHARRAHELAPDDPAVKDTLGVALLAEGKVDEALALLREAANKLPDNVEIAYHYAQALARGGDKDQARQVLRRVLDTGQAFSQRQEAEALLRELGS